MSDIQLTGNLQLNAGGNTPLADVSEFVAELRLGFSRDQIERSATLTRGRYVAAGGRRDQLVLGFYDDIVESGMWARLFKVLRQQTAEISFSGSLNPGDAGHPDNPLFEGVAVVTDLEVGTVVGDLRYQTLTFPIKELTVSEAGPPPPPPGGFDSFEDGTGTYSGIVQYWNAGAKFGIGFVANRDVLVHGARWYRKATFSASAPVLHIADVVAHTPAEESKACATTWAADGWETIMFDTPVAVPELGEKCVWITTQADVDLARDATYFPVPISSAAGYVTSLEPSGMFNLPKHSGDDEVPDGTADHVAYWVFPLVTDNS